MDWVYFTLAVLFGACAVFWYQIKLLRFACISTGGFFLMLLGGVTIAKFDANAAGSLLFFVGGITWIVMLVIFLRDLTLWNERRILQNNLDPLVESFLSRISPEDREFLMDAAEEWARHNGPLVYTRYRALAGREPQEKILRFYVDFTKPWIVT